MESRHLGVNPALTLLLRVRSVAVLMTRSVRFATANTFELASSADHFRAGIPWSGKLGLRLESGNPLA